MSPGLGVEAKGNIPSGLATPRPPGLLLEGWLLLVAGAIWIALANFAEAISPAFSFTWEHKYEVKIVKLKKPILIDETLD